MQSYQRLLLIKILNNNRYSCFLRATIYSNTRACWHTLLFSVRYKKVRVFILTPSIRILSLIVPKMRDYTRSGIEITPFGYQRIRLEKKVVVVFRYALFYIQTLLVNIRINVFYIVSIKGICDIGNKLFYNLQYLNFILLIGKKVLYFLVIRICISYFLSPSKLKALSLKRFAFIIIYL